MSRFFDIVSKPAREMRPYSPGARSAPDSSSRQVIHLDSNENPFGASPRAVQSMRMALHESNSYPDDDCSELRHKLADHHGLPAEQVAVTAGSTALLAILCQTLLEPGFNAVTSERSFIVYGMAVQAAGGQLIQAPMRDNGFDPEAIIAAINANTRIVFIANPNNPTGSMLDGPTVEKLIARVPGHAIIVLDEAYYEFAEHFASLGHFTLPRSLEYVKMGAGVVVLRTFSKAHGLAGLRIGYGLGPAELLQYCARMRNTFSVASIAQTAALAALEDHGHLTRVVENNAVEGKNLVSRLNALGLRVAPTAANFLFCNVEKDAAQYAARLAECGISVRPLGAWGAPTAVRITIGTPEQNQRLLAAMGELSGTS